jgi:hypothetical protein
LLWVVFSLPLLKLPLLAATLAPRLYTVITCPVRSNSCLTCRYYRFNLFRRTANIFRSFFSSSRLSTHVGKAPNYSGVSQSARLKHGIITARCNLATGRSRRTAILHLSSRRCGPAGAHGAGAACTVYKT